MNQLWSPNTSEINTIIQRSGAQDARLRSDTCVRVLTQNTQTHYGDKYAPPNFEERLLCLLDQMEHFDIVLLQELISVRVAGVNVASWRYWMIEKAKEKGFIFYADAKPNWFGLDNGCLILSRFPILQCYSMDFADSYNIKGAIRATIEVGKNKKLDVFCLHLDAHSHEVRRKQLAQLVSTFPQPRNDNYHCLIAGDFNVEEHSPEAAELQIALNGYTSVISDWLDYVFVIPGLAKNVQQPTVHKYKIKTGQPISDHNGLYHKRTYYGVNRTITYASNIIQQIEKGTHWDLCPITTQLRPII